LNVVRWLVTALTLALVAWTGTLSVHRVVGETLRNRADAEFAGGAVLAALDTYDRARHWDPLAPTAYTDAAAAAAHALAYRVAPLGEHPERAPAVAARGLSLFVGSIAMAPPASWSWAGVARLYEDLRTLRPYLEEIDLSRLAVDPLENLMPEDYLAEAALLQALRYEPDNSLYLDSLGELYWKRGLRDRALAPFRQAVAVYPILDGHRYVTDRVRESEELAAAVERGLATARETVPRAERWVVSRERGHLDRLRRRPAEAARHFAAAIEESHGAAAPHRAALHLCLSEVRQELGDLDGAIASLQEAVRLNSDRAQLHGRLGVLLGRADRHDEAMAALGLARALAPSDPLLARRTAEEYRRVGDLERAERAYQDLIRLQPRRVDPFLQVIDLFRSSGHHSRAVPYARELVRLHPDEPVYRVQLEQLYEQEARP
jgi:tetratricopeptide (TPR) repeat protein